MERERVRKRKRGGLSGSGDVGDSGREGVLKRRERERD